MLPTAHRDDRTLQGRSNCSSQWQERALAEGAGKVTAPEEPHGYPREQQRQPRQLVATAAPREVLPGGELDLPISSLGRAAAPRGDGCATQPRWLSHVPDSGVRAASSPGAQPQPWTSNTQPERRTLTGGEGRRGDTGGKSSGGRWLWAGGWNTSCSSGFPEKCQLSIRQMLPARGSCKQAAASAPAPRSSAGTAAPQNKPRSGQPPQLPPLRAQTRGNPSQHGSTLHGTALVLGHSRLRPRVQEQCSAVGLQLALLPQINSTWGNSFLESTNAKLGPTLHPSLPLLPGGRGDSGPGGSGPFTTAVQ